MVEFDWLDSVPTDLRVANHCADEVLACWLWACESARENRQESFVLAVGELGSHIDHLVRVLARTEYIFSGVANRVPEFHGVFSSSEHQLVAAVARDWRGGVWRAVAEAVNGRYASLTPAAQAAAGSSLSEADFANHFDSARIAALARPVSGEECDRFSCLLEQELSRAFAQSGLPIDSTGTTRSDAAGAPRQTGGVGSTPPTTKPGEGDGGAGSTPKKARSTRIPKLSDRQYNILVAMLELKAFTAESRATTDGIAEKAEGPTASPEQFKRPVSGLRRRRLLDSKTGRDGGCWLTDKGRQLAELIKKRRDEKR
jgi:hypothetical protein